MLNSKVLIRETVESDLEQLYPIRLETEVQKQQYRLTKYDGLDYWKTILRKGTADGRHPCRFTTILYEEQLVGYVRQTYFDIEDEKHCYAGWDLSPSVWGQGIMPTALAMLMDRLFCDEGIHVFFADCFRKNKRCIRVFEKLGFQRIKIPLEVRAAVFFATWSFRRLLRFVMTIDDWAQNPNKKRTGS